MGHDQSRNTRIRRWAAVAAAATTALIGAVVVTSPAVADVAPSGQLCFGVDGSPGDAAIVNVTPVEASGLGFGLLVSSDVKSDPPVGSNVNFGPGSVDPNVAVAPIGVDGEVCLQNSVHSSVDVVADHLGTVDGGVFTAASVSGAPARKVDTREGLGGSRLAPSGQLCFGVDGSPGDAAIVNVTPVEASGLGFGLLVSSDVKSDPPVGSNVNFGPGSVDPNVAVAPIGVDGEVCLQNSVHSSVDVVADHLGTVDGGVFTAASVSGAPDRKVDTRDDDIRDECRGSTGTGYETATARTMFGLSSRAYEVEPGEAQAGQLLHLIGDEAVHFAPQMSCWKLVAAIRGSHGLLGALTDTEVIVARNTETNDLAVAFRGTELNLVDIITDISATRVPWQLPNGQIVSNAVHGGFAGAYLAVRDQLLEVLRANHRAGVSDARVYFTGHSLGGALATVASLDLVDDMMGLGYARDEVATYTFGAPRSMSEQMVGHHATYVPVSFAVANPRDPVPHVPSAIGSNPYSQIRNMTVLNGRDDDTRVRVDRGDGRDYGGCTTLIPTVLDHVRTEYAKRIGATSYLGAPAVWITISNGENRLNWDSPLEGPCDWVGLWRTSGTLTNPADPIRDRNVLIDTNDIHTTTVGKGDDYWIGYVDIFGDLIATREYFPAAPSVSLRRNENFIGGDTIDFVWSVSDPGDHDLIVLFEDNPYSVGPNGYYRSIVGRVEAKADTNSPERTQIRVGSDPDRWWVAYVMVDDDGNQRILRTSHGVQG